MITCARCGTDNPAGFRFCGNCGAALAAGPSAGHERRKVVTVLFSDVAGSTSIGEQRDPEAMRAVMARYFETVRAVLERHGGTVEKFIGDAVMAVFGHPVLHEDDALRAVRAAADLRDELAALNRQLERDWGLTIEVRTGINTGAVVAGEQGTGETLVTGDAVNVAARLQAAAAPGETLIGGETYPLVRDAVTAEQLPPLSVKGKELPVNAWRLLAVARAASLGRARRLDSPLVGREREMRLLEEAFEQAVSDRTSVLFTLLGPAGVGKSRLVHEFLAGTRQRARVLRGRCLSYGQGITFWPLAEVVRQAAGIEESDAPEQARAKIERICATDEHGSLIARHVASAIGLSDETGGGEEIFWAVRRFLELLADEQPLVVVFDDIHWGEQTFLDLLEHITDWSRGAPMLLLCVARPELLDVRPGWAGGKLNATTVLLQALSDQHVGHLIGNLLGDAGVAEQVRQRVAQAAEGNPLFVEEFVAMLIDDGQLALRDGRWVATGELERVAVPATIRSLLAARIDRLAAPERQVLERASVVGKVFWRGALAELAPEPSRTEVGPSLMGLVRKELVRPDRSDFAGDDAFRFRHLLMRDAAYDGVPKQERVLLHERFAAWLERVAGERVAEYEELLGYHLEQAFRYRTELGPLDDAAHQLAYRAARRLAAAGLRAVDRGDMSAAANLLERAAELTGKEDGQGDELRAEILHGLCQALQELGRFDELRANAKRLAEIATTPRWRWRATYHDVMFGFLSAPGLAAAEGMAAMEAAIAELEAVGDELALAEVWNLRGQINYYLGDVAAARDCNLRALEHARRAGSEAEEAKAVTNTAALSVWDDEPIDEAIPRVRELLEWARASGRRVDEAGMLSIVGRLSAMGGDIDEGRRRVSQAREILAELGRRVHLAGSTHWHAIVEHMAGDIGAAERALREGAEQLERLGEKSFLSSSLAEMAVALAAQGKLDEAESAARRAAYYAASDDIEAQVALKAAQAIVLSQRGEVEEAVRMADEVLESADRSAYFITRLILRERLEPVVHAARGAAAAAELVGQGLAMARRKGVRALETRLMRRLAELDVSGHGAGEAASVGR
ncbi:MAG: AAA family ATPase [Chloroflexota bacterium]|nr:AAA family ATPase [Chloroflexota bacterium]